MLIECPHCHAQARTNAEQAGAKVRCAACKKIYVAEHREVEEEQGVLTPTRVVVGAVVVLLAGVIVVAIRASGDEPQAAPVAKAPPAEAPKPQVDLKGWESAPVKAVRAIYDAANARDVEQVRRMIHGPRAAEGRKPQDPTQAAAWVAFNSRSVLEREAFLGELAGELTAAGGERAATGWKPFDGSVTSEVNDPDDATVRVRVSPADAAGGTESLTFDWKLVKEGEQWKAWSWERHLTDRERRLEKREATGISKVEFEDGTLLYVADPRRVEHLESTTQELRERIDAEFKRMLDFSLHPKENNRALEELVAIGKPALPALLTGIYETQIVDHDTAAKVNLIDQALRQITGHHTGFSPHATIGGTEERRTAALKGWFGWWVRKGEAFTAAPAAEASAETDLLGND